MSEVSKFQIQIQHLLEKKQSITEIQGYYRPDKTKMVLKQQKITHFSTKMETELSKRKSILCLYTSESY